MATVTVGLLVVGAPRLFADLHDICVAECAAPEWQSSPNNMAALTAFGISIDAYALLVVGLHLVSSTGTIRTRCSLVSGDGRGC